MRSHASLLIFIFVGFLSAVSATCTVDSDCSSISYCYSSTCQPSISIGSRCSKSISSRKQCIDGYCNNTSICQTYIPVNEKCDPVSYPPLYTCEKGNYCQLINNITKSGKCQSTLPNGASCTMWQACTSQYCDIKTNAKIGTCATHPIVDLIVAAGMGILTIILIVIGSAIACCVGVCCWCYKMGRWQPPVIFNRQAPIIATTIPMQSNPTPSPSSSTSSSSSSTPSTSSTSSTSLPSIARSCLEDTFAHIYLV